MSVRKKAQIYTISPSVSFADTLAKGLIERYKETPEKLGNYLILLPTRRGCRTVQEAFLRQSNGVPLILPRLRPIGDIDEEELLIAGNVGEGICKIPPAISSLKRQILLGRIISKIPDISKGIEQDIALAHALGQLMDQIYTEDLEISNLPQIVDRETFADHWKITVDFLEILSVHWPQILQEQGVIDGADRRNRLINALQDQWDRAPPDYPVIVAGSTGSIPATSGLLKTIANLPKGCLILPGLDKYMSDEAWMMVEEGHPQNTIKELLENLECERRDVDEWELLNPESSPQDVREIMISNIMTPADNTHEWENIDLSKDDAQSLKRSIKNVQRLDCETPEKEALVIAILLRETIDMPEKTAALITPNRYLARRVATICKRWGIDIDDSGGQPLTETTLGIYLRTVIKMVIDKAAPVSLLSALKQDLCYGGGFENFRGTVRKMDIEILRGIAPHAGLSGIKKAYHNKFENDEVSHPDVEKLLNHLEDIIEPVLNEYGGGYHKFSDILSMHLKLCEKLSSSNDTLGEDVLWQGEAGESAANFLSELNQHAQNIPNCNVRDYLGILEHFMKSINVRSKYGTHPRVTILGQLEARLIQADRVILSGLNEGSWPPDLGHDPWMSRPMRLDFGLPKPERAITLAAHDFSQAFCSREVFLTRAKREDGMPRVPARWLERMDTFLKAIKINPDVLRQSSYLSYADALDAVEGVKPIQRPAPTPPILARPTRLSVTKIEKWMKDPYSIYASSVLKLYPVDALEKEIGAMERGNILHETLEQFTNYYPDKIVPDEAKDYFINIAKTILKRENIDDSEWNFWLPRLSRVTDWLIPEENKWRETACFYKSEIKGEIKLQDGLKGAFTLSGIADRVDFLHSDGAAIIDYKSGGQYSLKKIESGGAPQLPLEALILNENGFSEYGVIDKKTNYIGYWKMTGGRENGKVISIHDEEKLNNIIQNTKVGLINLIHAYEQEEMPYLALPRLDNVPAFNDYEHLERVKEWAALDGNEEDAA